MTQDQIEAVIIDVLYDSTFIEALATAIHKAIPAPGPTPQEIVAEIPKIVGQPTFVAALATAILAAFTKA